MANLGEIRPTRTPLQQREIRTSAAQFGSGVGLGLRGIAEAYVGYEASQANIEEAEFNRQEALKDAEFNLQERYRARQKVLDRHAAMTDMIRLNGELDRDLVEAADDPGKYPDGFANYAEQEARKRSAEFISGLPEELQAEFASRTESVVQSSTNKALDIQIRAEDAAYLKDFADVQQTAVDSILAGEGTKEQWAAMLNEMAENSPLAALDTEKIIDSALRTVELAQISVDARTAVQATSPQSPYLTKSFDTPSGAKKVMVNGQPVFVNPGMTPHTHSSTASKMTKAGADTNLKKVLAGPYQRLMENFGRPVVINDMLARPGSSRERNRKGSQHFRGTALDLSTAGMTDSEKIELFNAALAAGFKAFGFGKNILHVDMGPRRAWGYGNSTYGGKSVAALKKLAQNAQGTVPVSAPATPDDIMESGSAHSDMYPNLTYLERQSAVLDAMAQHDKLLAAQSEQRATQLTNNYNNLRFGIEEGTAGLTEIENFRSTYPELTFEKYDKLVTEFEAKNERAFALNDFIGELTSDVPLNASRTETKAGFEEFITQMAGPEIENMNGEFFSGGVVPATEQMGAVHPQIQNQLLSMMRSANPERMEFAFQALSALQVGAPIAWNKLAVSSPEMASVVRYYNDMKKDYTPDELAALVRSKVTPGTQQELQVFTEELKTIRREQPGFFSAPSIIEEMGLDPETVDSFGTYSELERQFMNRFEAEYRLYRDPDKAREAAIERMQERWGVSEATGEEVFMQFPPELFGPSFKGGHEYMQEQLRESLDLQEGESPVIVQDGQTELDLAKGSPPSYMLGRRLADGAFMVERSVSDPLNIIRYFPEVTEQMKRELAEEQNRLSVENNLKRELGEVDLEIKKRERELEQLRNFDNLGFDEDPSIRSDIQEELNDLKEERSRIVREGFDQLGNDFLKPEDFEEDDEPAPEDPTKRGSRRERRTN